MPNLVGTGLNQVPTNSMLGGLAYQDPEHASIKNLDLKNLSQINSEIADTAVDVFVYDTSKDSDGGAWRKRTQNTSWYNETLGTATRGTRKEFPAVAVIVSTLTKVTIYDGDDPDLPMWMVFLSGPDSANERLLRYAANNASEMLNAILCVSTDDTLVYISFIDEYHNLYHTSNEYWFPERTGIVDRNIIIVEPTQRSVASGIRSADTNDIAMTVLPNAPVDSATGLPIPTIAVGTDDGISIIKDDGSVVDLYVAVGSYDTVMKLSFTDDNKISYTVDGTDQSRAFRVDSIPSSDFAVTSNQLSKGNGEEFYVSADYGFSTGDLAFSKKSNEQINDLVKRNVAHTTGLSLIEKEDGGPRHAFVTSSFNTGWMHGDIKGAFLSDTTVESLTANTNLASSATQTATARLTSETYTDGATSWQMVDNAGNDNGYLAILFGGLTTGQSYHLSMTVDANASLDAGYEHKIEQGSSIVYLNHWNGTGAGTLTANFTAVSGTNALYFYANGITVNVTNFNIRSVDDEDRSVNNNGLAVYGTLTKSAVATGAELVGYSGFTGSNYLRYNASDMAFGTGDFSVSLWCIPSTDTTSEFILELDDSSQGSNRFYFLTTNTATKRLYLPWDSDIAGSDLTPGQWNHIVVGRKSGYGFVYVNNKWIADGYKAWTTALNGNGNGTISNYSAGPSNDYAWSGSLALLRISGSAPSAEQVSKMYHDEKFLFQENAKCTLYGSSDAVTALAFDEVTDQLHVGTSAGRSDFQGLRRINNTTTAVTTAISAHDEFIIEQ